MVGAAGFEPATPCLPGYRGSFKLLEFSANQSVFGALQINCLGPICKPLISYFSALRCVRQCLLYEPKADIDWRLSHVRFVPGAT